MNEEDRPGPRSRAKAQALTQAGAAVLPTHARQRAPLPQPVPMGSGERRKRYLAQTGHLTPAQRRRLLHKTEHGFARLHRDDPPEEVREPKQPGWLRKALARAKAGLGRTKWEPVVPKLPRSWLEQAWSNPAAMIERREQQAAEREERQRSRGRH
jgi:hypothetical protein